MVIVTDMFCRSVTVTRQYNAMQYILTPSLTLLLLFLSAEAFPATAGAAMVLAAAESSSLKTVIDPESFMTVFMAITGVVAGPVLRKKHDRRDFSAPVRIEPGAVDWQSIDRAACRGVLDGAAGGMVNAMMRGNDVRKIHRNRIALVMDALGRSSSPMLELYAVVENSYEWKALVLRYFHEVCLEGYAEINERFASLTRKGSAFLEQARADGFDPALWGFMERRLHETVAAVCPHCGSATPTYFFRDTYVCSGCRERLELNESASLTLSCSDLHLQPRRAVSQ